MARLGDPSNPEGAMSRRRRVQRARSGQAGQAMVEYLVVAALLLALVAVPIDGADSAIELLLQAIHTAYTKFLAALSIPQ
jgi:hypothetical protein